MKIATQVPCIELSHLTDFNPRYREDSDIQSATAGVVALISIHAIVKIATLTINHSLRADSDFNPRYREDSDPNIPLIIYRIKANFNPRYREDSDSEIALAIAQEDNFNPRYREDSDMSECSFHFIL